MQINLRTVILSAFVGTILAILEAVYLVAVFARATFETIFLGKSARKQLRRYEEDVAK